MLAETFVLASSCIAIVKGTVHSDKFEKKLIDKSFFEENAVVSGAKSSLFCGAQCKPSRNCDAFTYNETLLECRLGQADSLLAAPDEPAGIEVFQSKLGGSISFFSP